MVTRFPPVVRSFFLSVDSRLTILTVLISKGFSFGRIPGNVRQLFIKNVF